MTGRNVNRPGRSRTQLNREIPEILRDIHEITSVALSKSSQKNCDRAMKTLRKFASQFEMRDPDEVSEGSSRMIINLLQWYCQMGSPEALGDDSMGSMIQGLRHAYNAAGHTLSFTVDRMGNASGNPLIGNPEITTMRKAHRVLLAKYGRRTLRARPITVAMICAHSEKYWYDGIDCRDCEPNAKDVLIHAILVVGINLGLRFDELQKLRTEYLSAVGDDVTMTITETIKNSHVRRDYSLHEWPGNTALRHSIYMDPKIALLTWLSVRGKQNGYIFCDMRESRHGMMIDPSKNLTGEKFNVLLQARLRYIGVGSGDVRMYTGHSIKRGCVQLYRSLNCRDEYIMELIQMSGAKAYFNYCMMYNDCTPKEMPRFSSYEDMIAHCNVVVKEQGFESAEEFAEHFKEIFPRPIDEY